MDLIKENVSALATKLGSTPEVITKFLTDAAASEEVKPFADTLGTLQIFTPEQFTQRLSNETAEAATAARNTAVGNTYGAMDKRILAETGIAKLRDDEPTIDYMARAAKEKFGKAGNEPEEIKQLRQAVADKDALLVQKNGELEQLKVAHATEAKTLQINSKLDAAINGLAIESPADRLDSQREFVKFKFMQKYEADLVDGKVVFKDKATGQVVKDTTTASPLTEAALVAQFAPTVVSLKQSQKRGAGVNSSADTSNQGADNFSDFATLDDYKKHLTQSGVTLLSQAGQDKIAAYIGARDKK
jgi:hypothetical protein